MRIVRSVDVRIPGKLGVFEFGVAEKFGAREIGIISETRPLKPNLVRERSHLEIGETVKLRTLKLGFETEGSFFKASGSVEPCSLEPALAIK